MLASKLIHTHTHNACVYDFCICKEYTLYVIKVHQHTRIRTTDTRIIFAYRLLSYMPAVLYLKHSGNTCTFCKIAIVFSFLSVSFLRELLKFSW